MPTFMGLPNKSATHRLSTKVSSLELHRIIQGRKNLDGVEALAQPAIQYKLLGWSPVALDAHTGADLQVDFGQPDQVWLNLLMNLALRNDGVCLGIQLESSSQLFVLKVNPGFGKDFLDGLGDWRSACIARAGDSWEHHFFLLPPAWRLYPPHLDQDKDAPLSVLGADAVVAVPPSVDPVSLEIWDWLQPPWQQPPRYPAPVLLFLLEEAGFISRKGITPKKGPSGERPEKAATSPSPENLWKELQLLAGLAVELEQQVEELERRHPFSTLTPPGNSSAAPPEKSASMTLVHPRNHRELEEFRGQVEEFRKEKLLDS